MKHQMIVSRPGEFSYKIIWQKDFSMLAREIQELNTAGKKVCIVTDSNVGPLYGDIIRQELSGIFSYVTSFTFPSGEESKTLDTVSDLLLHLIQEKFERSDILVALGGGVVGDLTGFAASIYLRGIDFIQIPTTLLSQVDSSIGGKTGVDLGQFKNMVGAFHQPRLVYMVMETLASLSDEQFACGMGEVLKSGLIRDISYYHWVLKNREKILNRNPEILGCMIQGACSIKRIVVQHDPTEKSERAILNFGHTIGHAVEKQMNFTLLHGQCVALGMVAAAYISWKMDNISQEDFLKIQEDLVSFQLPIRVEPLPMDPLIDATRSDKKMEGGVLKFIVLDELGYAVINREVTEEELRAAAAYIMGKED